MAFSGRLRGALFDLDGTLVESHLDFAAIRQETGFPEGVGLLEHVQQLEDKADRERAMAIIHRHERDGALRSHWMPEAEYFLAAVGNAGLPIGIVTRNSRETALLMIERLQIPCDELIAREDAAAKPDPAGLLAIASGWQLPPSDLFYLGDHRFDLQAARRGGLLACLYAPGGTSEFASEADITVTSYTELGVALGLELH